MRVAASVIAVCIVLTLPGPALAQEGVGIRGYGSLGVTFLAAADSFDAVAGTSRALNIGGGVAATLWKGLFVDVSASRITIDGERVFVDQGTVFPLNIPLEVTMTPFDIAAGWRGTGRISPYGGAGLTRISYKETSDFAADGEDVDGSGTGLLVLGGVDVAVSTWVHVGGEVRYRSVDGPLGESGVSAVFGEQSIGGFSTSVRVSFGR